MENNLFSKRGMTLVEVIVAMTVFIIIVGVAIGILSSSLQAQRRSLALQELLDQTGYAMEYMGRALRMAKKELGEGCLSGGRGLNYEITHGGSGIKFINHLQDDDCQEFYLADNGLKYRRKIGQAEEEVLDLTSSHLVVESLGFNIAGESQWDDVQPRVTIFLKIKGRGLISRPELQIQTTVSQRNIDIKY